MKFSIRDLLLVTVIVALDVGSWDDRSQVEKTPTHRKLLTPLASLS